MYYVYFARGYANQEMVAQCRTLDAAVLVLMKSSTRVHETSKSWMLMVVWSTSPPNNCCMMSSKRLTTSNLMLY